MKKTIFLSGMPRANTTLMANIIRQNPNFMGGETSPLLEYIYASRGNFSNSPEVRSALTEGEMKKSFLAFCKGGIDAYANEMRGNEKSCYLDKSRGWLHYAPFLWEVMPDAKIIIMVRDIRGVVSSLEKKWRDNPCILDSRDNPTQQQFITVDQRANHFLAEPPLGIALKRLYNAVQTGVIKNKNILVVRAEELCKKTKEVMQKVYEFIGEDYFDADYTNVKQVTVENDRIEAFGIYGSHTIRPSIEPLKKDYDDILGKKISENIKSNYNWFYEAFDYF